MRKSISLLISVLLIVGLLFATFGCSANEAGDSNQTAANQNQENTTDQDNGSVDMSGQIVIATHEIGTGGYQTAALMIEGMVAKFPGLNIRTLPAGTETTRSYFLRLGDAHCQLQGGSTTYYLQEGLIDYDVREWGPQPVRVIYYGIHNGYTFGVKANSGIDTVADLKGKRVASLPSSASTNMATEAMLAYAGLTWDDVIAIDYPSVANAYQAVIDGKVDACFYNVSASKAYEAMSSPGGLKFLTLPGDNKEAWARAQDVLVTLVPRVTTFGAGLSESNPLECASEPYPVYLTIADADEDTIYKLTKALNESRPEWAAKDQALKKDFTLENHWFLFDNGAVPLHPGAIRYYKEIGQWTEDREKKNNELIAHQEKLKEVWDNTVKAAEEQKIPSTEFPEFWLGAREKAGL